MTPNHAPPGLIQPEPTSADSVSPLAHLLNRLQPSPETVVLLLAVVIGGGAGVGVIVFRSLIVVVHQLMLGEVSSFLSTWGHWTLALIPVLGGLLVGLMRWQVKDFGPGLAVLLDNVQQGREILPLKPITKMLAAGLSLGSGASLGPEGPSVEIGAHLSLLLGQILQVSRERQRLLLSAGAAAGLAAGFNAPIAGVFFALEVVLGTTFAASAVSVVLLAAVVAAWVAQMGLGAQPAFALPAYEVRSLLELPLYLGLGCLASLVSLLYVQAIALSQRCFKGQIRGTHWLANIPKPLHPVLGGIGVGLVALQLPQILGVGYETIEAILQDLQLPLQLVLALLVVKLVMTAISFGSGFVGGVFAPALFLGAALGSAYGKVLAIALPMLHDYMASPPAYAMVGMAAVLAASVRAPLTAILLLFELTQDYRIVLPLMAAVGLSIWLNERLQPQGILETNNEPVSRADVQLGTESLPPLTVADAMQAKPLQVPGHFSTLAVGAALVQSRHRSALVINDEQQLVGIVTLQDVNRLSLKARENPALLHQPIQSVCTTEVLSAFEDEPLPEAIARMAARGLQQLPVVSRGQPPQTVGLLTQEDVELAYAIARTQETLNSNPIQHSAPDRLAIAASTLTPERLNAEVLETAAQDTQETTVQL